MSTSTIFEFETSDVSRGPFLERPGNLTDPKTYFEIKVSRRVGCLLTSIEVSFDSLADTFTVPFSKLLNLPCLMENKTRQLNGPGNYRELRKTGPGALALRVGFR